MGGNSFGDLFRITTFGESHGSAIGGVLDGCPAGLPIDEAFITREMSRRKPGQSAISSPRKEDDTVEILSGVFEGKSTGTPIAILIRNKDQISSDYNALKEVYRPGHADFVYQEKYGIRDYRGGGRSSARETAVRVAFGSIAKMFLSTKEIRIQAYVDQIGTVKIGRPYNELNLDEVDNFSTRMPDADISEKAENLIQSVRAEGDSLGGAITCIIRGAGIGLGEPVFDKRQAVLGHAMLSINAVRGFEIGEGVQSIEKRGSEMNDQIGADSGKAQMMSNNSGGIQGGISNGEDIVFRVAFKPVSTIEKAQQTVNHSGEQVTLQAKGRHDPCVVPRAVPIVEAMAALVIADFVMKSQNDRIK